MPFANIAGFLQWKKCRSRFNFDDTDIADVLENWLSSARNILHTVGFSQRLLQTMVIPAGVALDDLIVGWVKAYVRHG